MRNFIIPEALQIDMDDMGWFCGTDDRKNGGPSRTGISRRHTAADYAAVNELGRRLNMKINCAFIIGEWDPDNRLRAIPHLSKFGGDWNNSAYYDTKTSAECVKILNEADYINLCVHGLLHGYYMEGTDNHDCSDYYYTINKELFMAPEEEIRQRLDAFFDLLRYHGIKKQVDTMIPPSFRYRFNELSYILKDYGIRYVGTIFRNMICEGGEAPVTVGIEKNGMIIYDRRTNPIPWNRLGADYETMPLVSGLVGTHWPNFLHEDPERNLENVERAEAYFRRCGAQFESVLSRDVVFFVTQAMYRRFAKAEEDGSTLTVDISAVPNVEGLGDSFYINTKQPIKSAEGCTATVYETHPTHTVYEIKPQTSLLRLFV